MTGSDVIADCRFRGVELSAAGDRLHYRGPADAVDSALLILLTQHKPDLIRLLSGPRCPGCGYPVDDRGRCWGCEYRRCEACGRPTGSVLIGTCWPCGLLVGGSDGTSAGRTHRPGG